MPITIDRRDAVAMERLNISADLAALITSRHLDTCQTLVESMEKAVNDMPIGSCCKPGDGEWHKACEHVLRLWAARGYRDLAFCQAPLNGAWPCDGMSCHGTGRYTVSGYTENDVFHGVVGQCFRCGGKGWLTAADRKRNAIYDNNYRRIAP